MLVAAMLARGWSWRTPYRVLAVVELALSFTFVATRQLWRDEPVTGRGASLGEATGPRRAMQASVLMFLFYGGVEAGTGLWATSLLTMTRGASPAQAGALLALYWAALTLGRFVLGAVADVVGAMRLLKWALRTAVVAAAAVALPGTPVWFVGAALAVLGFTLAPVYPLTMHDAATRYGATAARVVGYQVAACSIGVATLPWLLGKVGARAGVLAIPPLLLILAVATACLEVLRRRHPAG